MHSLSKRINTLSIELGASVSSEWYIIAPSNICEAKSLNNLGLVAHERSEFETAEEYHEEALSLFQEIGNRQAEARILKNLGNVAKQRSNLPTAEEHYNESLILQRKLGNRHGEAGCLRHLGRLAQARDEFACAREHFAEALRILREEEIIPYALDSFGELIDVCDQQGATARAIEWCEEAIDFAAQTEHPTKREEFQDRRSAYSTQNSEC